MSMSSENTGEFETAASPLAILIVQNNADLGDIWAQHLRRQGMQVTAVQGQQAAIAHLEINRVDTIILDVVLEEGAALAISAYAEFRHPEARVIFVTNTSFFSDGSIFAHASNARAFLPSSTPPEDIAAMVEHYAAERQRG